MDLLEMNIIQKSRLKSKKDSNVVGNILKDNIDKLNNQFS